MAVLGKRADTRNFNPRSPHGERLHNPRKVCNLLEFQSTLPARGATGAFISMILTNIFQSTLPARGATTARQHPDSRMAISIHAPRTGSDNSIRTGNIQTALHFNPRSPHGERRGCPTVCCDRKKHFNPRSPHGERLSFFDFTRVALYISIHAPRTGSDEKLGVGFDTTLAISIHAPRTGSDMRALLRSGVQNISIHAPRTGSDQRRLLPLLLHWKISIHAPRTGSDPAQERLSV